jgi:integrase
MTGRTELERRDKAIFAFLMIAGARVGAVSSLRLKHINLVDGPINPDR